MPIELGKPETFLFAFSKDGNSVAVAIVASNLEEARRRFQAMSPTEKRQNAVAMLDRGERDHVADLVNWFKDLVTRFRSRPAISR